mmetsp:Transcript_28735/g.80907  ORF Transcript_28735/g.80907 Transcript_28735/m.80907 type:complete len:510 (-) Transcript_28735:217-1746(-)
MKLIHTRFLGQLSTWLFAIAIAAFHQGAAHGLDVPAVQQCFSNRNSPFDLAATLLRFRPQKYVCALEAPGFPHPSDGVVLNIGDNGSREVSFEAGFRFPFFGETYGSVFIGTNGFLTFTGRNRARKGTIKKHNNVVRISALMADLSLDESSSVSYVQQRKRFVVTYRAMHRNGKPSQRASFQVALFTSGKVEIAYMQVSIAGRICAGLSSGIPVDAAQVDLNEKGCGREGTCRASNEAVPLPPPPSALGTAPAALPPHSVRIIGGDEPAVGRYPFIVNVANDQYIFCTGSLIAPNIVLTAAHCSPSTQVLIGSHELSTPVLSSLDTIFEILQVELEISHPDFVRATFENDVKLLILKDKSCFTPVLLDSPQDNVDLASPNQAGRDVSVIGWGITASEQWSPVLQEADLITVSDSSCRGIYGTRAAVNPGMICATFRPDGQRKGDCAGDSGGPLIVKGTGALNDIQVGIVSWAFGCGDSFFPGVYASVEFYYDWIRDELAKLGAELRTSY